MSNRRCRGVRQHPEMASWRRNLSAGSRGSPCWRRSSLHRADPRFMVELREWVALKSLECQCLFATRFFEARDVLESADRQA
jgi:hypothetical protein